MGVFTRNNKRGNDCCIPFAVFSPQGDQSDIHIQKILKSGAPGGNISRIPQYPDVKLGFRRAVHAPVGNSCYGYASGKGTAAIFAHKERPAYVMDGCNDMFLKYKNVRAEALESLQYVGKIKEKAVIELDRDNESRDNISDDSSVEKVDTLKSAGNRPFPQQWAVGSSHEGMNGKIIDKEVRSLESSGVEDEGNVDANEDVTEKMDIMKLGPASGDSSLPLYKRILDAIKNVTSPKLRNLNSDIESNVNFLRYIRSIWPRKKEKKIEKDLAEECFLPLSKEEEIDVSKALSNSNRGKILVTHENSNIDISVEKILCLKPGGWLNDEVINLYLELLKEREKREPHKFLKCHFFNTFFYKKLINGRGGYNFQSVKRWTTQRKIGYSLLDCQKIFVPIHKDIHWCLAIINKKEEKFQYLDSLRGVDSRVLDVLARYYVDEVKDKSGKEINVSSWEHEFVEDLPDQENGYDCGVFMIKYADFHSRDIGLCFSQEHMPYFRRRTAKEILKLRAD